MVDTDNLVNINKNININGFINHVFNFDSENKANMYNLVQYISIGIIPITIILKLIKNYIPEEDDRKGSIEITLEIFIQLLAIFFSIWFIDKFIRFWPTFSKVNYHKFNELNLVLPLLIILITMQTKLGAKINILCQRLLDLWSGNQTETYNNKNNNNNVSVSQPIITPGVNQPSRADNLDNSNPPTQMNNQMSNIDSLPNILNQNNNNQPNMVNAFDQFEPMAANGALGGSFGSNF